MVHGMTINTNTILEILPNDSIYCNNVVSINNVIIDEKEYDIN